MISLQTLWNALLILTDDSSKGRAGYLMNNQQVVIETPGLSAQLAELTAAVLKVFQSVNYAFNIFTDSLYVAQSIPLLDTCGTFNFNMPAGSLFSQLQNIIPA